MVSIVGMTLPGLSGSLIVLILGNYNLLLVDAVNGLFYTLTDLTSGQGLGLDDPERRRLLRVFVLFTLGSSFGLVFFKIAGKNLAVLQNTTIAVLVGFILGPLAPCGHGPQQALRPMKTSTCFLQLLTKNFFSPIGCAQKHT